MRRCTLKCIHYMATKIQQNAYTCWDRSSKEPGGGHVDSTEKRPAGVAMNNLGRCRTEEEKLSQYIFESMPSYLSLAYKYPSLSWLELQLSECFWSA